MKAVLRTAALLAVGLAAGSCTNLLGSFELVCETPCGAPSDCPDPMNPCVERTCTNGCCGTEPLPDTTVVTPQPSGTCQRVACDGAGNTKTLVDDTNTPPPVDQCHSGGCVAGAPAQADKVGGTPCSIDGGSVCGAVTGAAAGTCVACNATADCKSGTVCVENACVPASCMDVVKDGTETDVDCGGTTCPGCATGKVCLVAHDCVSGVCTGGTCAAPTCTDGVKNGTESDVDCGGTGCPACAYGDKCVQPTDCASTFCVTAKCGAGVLATGQAGAHGIALDASTLPSVHSVYWTVDTASGGVRRVLANGTASYVNLFNQTDPTGVAVGTTAAGNAYLLWTAGALTGGSVPQAVIGTAPGPVISPLSSGLMAASAIVADSTNAYWLTAGAVMQGPYGTATTATSSVVRGVVTSPVGIAVHTSGDIFWTSGGAAGSVNKILSGTGMSTSVVQAANQDNPGAIVIDHLNAYWCNNVASTGSVMKLPTTPLGTPVALATGQNQPVAIALDTTYVYWATGAMGTGTVSKVPIDGSTPPVLLVSGETTIAAIAVDDGFVYWTNPFDGTVKRVHK